MNNRDWNSIIAFEPADLLNIFLSLEVLFGKVIDIYMYISMKTSFTEDFNPWGGVRGIGWEMAEAADVIIT